MNSQNNWIVVSYYTPNYKEIAEQYLIPSVKKFNLPYNIIEVKDMGNWKNNTNFKPSFLKEQLKTTKKDLVFIDCDATINSYPELFNNIPEEFDIGVHTLDPLLLFGHNKIKPHIASGTLYIKNSERIFSLIDKWISFLPHVRWEQMALEKALNSMPEIKIYNLPREYCYIVNKPNGTLPHTPLDNPVINHFQKSRLYRNK